MSDETRTGERHERRTVIAYPNKDRRVAGQEISICDQCSEAWPCENERLRDRVAELEVALRAVSVPLINGVVCWCEESRDMRNGHGDACRQAGAALAGEGQA